MKEELQQQHQVINNSAIPRRRVYLLPSNYRYISQSLGSIKSNSL